MKVQGHLRDIQCTTQEAQCLFVFAKIGFAPEIVARATAITAIEYVTDLSKRQQFEAAIVRVPGAC